MTLMSHARRVLHIVTAVIVGLQALAVAGLMATDAIARRRRKPHRFPTARPTALDVGPNEVRVYTFGEDLYKDMLQSINSAETSVYFETFIWKSDEVGQLFKDALIAADRRGVKVFLVWDAFANLVVPPSFYDFPDSVHIRRHPLFSGIIPRLRNSGRDHRKIMIVDHEIAYVGGYNIGSLYADRWRDTHIQVTGPAVAELENAFVDYWNMRPLGLIIRDHGRPVLDSPAQRDWDVPIKVHKNMPRWAVYPIRNMYLEAIDRGEKRVWLTQAYLIPDEDFIHALAGAVDRGADVRIIVPAESNHVIADWLSRGFYDSLLTKGIRLFLYQDAMVHAKTATIDGVWSTVGTANLDRLSLAGNYEINAEITDPDFAAEMEKIFEMDLRNCRELSLDEWRKRSMIAKGTEELLAPYRPLF